MGCGSANSIDNKVVIFLIGKPGCGQKLQGKKVSDLTQAEKKSVLTTNCLKYAFSLL